MIKGQIKETLYYREHPEKYSDALLFKGYGARNIHPVGNIPANETGVFSVYVPVTVSTFRHTLAGKTVFSKTLKGLEKLLSDLFILKPESMFVMNERLD